MRSITDFFHRPAFSRVNKDHTPEANATQAKTAATSPSSPLTEPPPSSFLEQISREMHDDVETRPNDKIQVLITGTGPQPAPLQQSFQSAESAAGLSSLGGSFQSSQRIIKGGKEVVISSDGEDTDSISSLEDPGELFRPKSQQTQLEVSTERQSAMRTDKAFFLAKTSAPKYKNTIDSLVHDAVDDNEIEANVARVKATFVRSQSNDDGIPGAGPYKEAKTKHGLQEDMLTSALGDDEDGIGLQRLLDAVRRTEALEQDRVWRFFAQDENPPPAPEFPRDSFQPGTYMAVLRGLFCCFWVWLYFH